MKRPPWTEANAAAIYVWPCSAPFTRWTYSPMPSVTSCARIHRPQPMSRHTGSGLAVARTDPLAILTINGRSRFHLGRTGRFFIRFDTSKLSVKLIK